VGRGGLRWAGGGSYGLRGSLTDERLQFGAKEIAGAEEAALDGALGKIEAAGGGRDIHLMKVIQDEDLAVFRRQGLDGSVEGGVAVAFVDVAVESVVESAGIGGFVDLVEGKGDGWDAAQLGAVEVGGEREEPGGEDGLVTPGGEVAEGAEEGLLSHLLGTAAVAAEAVGEVDERRLPAAYDALEGGGFSGEDSGCVALVFGCAQAFFSSGQ
jgi:hypothetical protein